jgi:outer membrane protein assembly factor BamB
MPGRALVLITVVACSLIGAQAAYAGSTWLTAAGNTLRTADDTTEPNLLPLHNAWNAAMDATVYGQPLVFDGRVFAATENNTVYALDAHDGHVLWSVTSARR